MQHLTGGPRSRDSGYVSDSFDSEPGEFVVVMNDEEQYSIWPADRELPRGWSSVGVRGPKDECLAHIETVWTDMRPRSLREAMERDLRGDPKRRTKD